MQVPDKIEPAVGYRVWKVDLDHWRLLSLNHHAIWAPYETFVADCRVRGHPEPPVEGCTCGTYAAATFNRLYDMGYTKQGGLFSGRPGDVLVAGSVNLWGRVIPGTHGWRAQFSYPKKLLVPYIYLRYAKRIAEEYGVPFKPFNIVRKH